MIIKCDKADIFLDPEERGMIALYIHKLFLH